MAGDRAALGTELIATGSTSANDALVAVMKTIRSDIIAALQLVDQQRLMSAEDDAIAKAVAWLMKNKDQLLQVIHDLATPKNEAVPAAGKTLTDVIHAHPPPLPLERRLTPASRIALIWSENALLRIRVYDIASLRFARCAADLLPQRPTRAGANE